MDEQPRSRPDGVDADFLALPRDQLASAALEAARSAGAEHADVRVERVRDAQLNFRDGALASSADGTDSGLGVRVLVDGTFGFASVVSLDVDAAAAAARQAVELAKVSRRLNQESIELAGEPVYPHRTWVSEYQVDPFAVGQSAWAELLADWSARLDGRVTHSNVTFRAVKEQKHYADSAGTVTTQQRVRVQPSVEVTLVGDDGVETMDSVAPPASRGWEYATAGPAGGGWDYDTELARLPEDVAEKLAAPSVEAGRYDLLIDPTNLWLTIHESIGHATELDRALGYEAAYAGTSFATPDQLGRLQYGSERMHVTGDRTDPYGLASVGWDDEGVQAQRWDLVRDGVLVGFQLDRRMAHGFASDGDGSPARSNGCAFADSARHIAMQRMANVSLQPLADGPDLAGLLDRLGDGIYVVGDRSWSIDMQRYNFQFTGQRFYRVRAGRLVGQVKDVAYQATTTDFWRSMSDIGGPSTYLLGGAFNCGKAQPGQVAAVSHGSPAAVFRGVNILNTRQEAGQ